MQTISLAAIPNQSLSVTLNSIPFDLSFRWTGKVMVWSVTVNTVPLLSNSRMINGQLLIPYRYLEYGNFMLITEDDVLPDYSQFGTTQSLFYITSTELVALR